MENSFWIWRFICSHIHKCVTWKKPRGALQDQKKADLPDDSLEPSPQFTSCAIDYFSPWFIRQGRKEVKGYGVLFICMASRAVHFDVSNLLQTGSFIYALRRFICRRRPIRLLRCDCGTNFVGAKREPKEAPYEMDQKKEVVTS